ncbi:MAG: DUF4097 domain-containing protein [Clostridium sp.]|nr:DUF4097 domain-containing protein [Clostridium sp.]
MRRATKVLLILGIVFLVLACVIYLLLFRMPRESVSWGEIPGVSNFLSRFIQQDGNGLYDIEDWDLFEKGQEVLEGTIEKRLLADGSIEKIKMELGGCIISIADSKDEFIYLEADKIDKLQAYTQDNTLYILSASTDFFSFGVSLDKSANITLYLPLDKQFQEIDLNVGAVDAKLNHLSANAVNVEVGAGAFQVDKIDCSKLDINIGAGKFSAGTIHCNELAANVGAGSLEVESADVQGNADLEVNAGTLQITLLGAKEDYNYEINCALGSARIGNTKHASLGKETIQNNSAWTVDVEVNVGSLTLLFNDK